MQMIVRLFLTCFFLAATHIAFAADYKIDTAGAHASINFTIPHLGYSILVGRFDKFEGDFSYDPENLKAASVSVTVDTTSINSNHAERDKHLKSDDFLAVGKYPKAQFVSTGYTSIDASSGKLSGKLTLRGVTKDIVLDISKVGEGKDPWGGYRAGFDGNVSLNLKEFGFPQDLGPASQNVQLQLHVEGVRQ